MCPEEDRVNDAVEDDSSDALHAVLSIRDERSCTGWYYLGEH